MIRLGQRMGGPGLA